MQIKPLTNHILPQNELEQDTKDALPIDNSAVGQKALYLPGKIFPRAYYIPLAVIQRAFLRLVVGQKTNAAFRQPLLVLVVDGSEQVFLYRKEETVRSLLAQLEATGISVGKPKPPKPN